MKKYIIALILFFILGVGKSFAYDLSTLTQNGVVSSFSSYNAGFIINPDGTKVITTNLTATNIEERTLSIPFDFSTKSKTYTLNTTYTTAGITMSEDGLHLVFIDAYSGSSHKYLYYYKLNTPFVLSTASLQYTKVTSYDLVSTAYTKTGDKLLGCDSAGNCSEYLLSNNFIINGTETQTNYNIGFDTRYGIQFIDNDLSLLVNVYNNSINKQLHLITPGTLQFGYTTTDFITTGVNGFSNYLYNNGQNLLALGSTTGFDFLTNEVFGPLPLEITSTGSIINFNDGITINNFETNEDYDLSFYINNITDDIDYVDFGNFGFMTGGLVNIDLQNNTFEPFIFEYGKEYEINLILEDYNDGLNTQYATYNVEYLPLTLGQPIINSITAIQDGLEIEFFCDSQCQIDYTIYFDFCDPGSACNEKTNNFGIVGPGIFTGQILESGDLFFNNYEDYLIDFTISDINFGVVNYLFEESVLDYYFNPEPEVILEEDFSFSIYNVEYKNNGFIVNDFVPEPYGGFLWFDIIGPTGTGTIDAGPIFRKSLDPVNGYGEDTQINIDYPYHEEVGNYQMRFRYNWGEYNIYPYGTGFVNYYITEPQEFGYYEVGDLSLEESVFSCDTDGDGELGVGEFLYCVPLTLKHYVTKVYSFFDNIRKLIGKIGGAFTTEVKEFSFLQTTHANDDWKLQNIINNNVDEDAYKDTVLGKFDTFFKGFIAFLMFVIGLVIFISLSRKKHG